MRNATRAWELKPRRRANWPFSDVTAVLIILLLDVVQPRAESVLSAPLPPVILLLGPELALLLVVKVVQVLVEITERRPLAHVRHAEALRLLIPILLLLLLLLPLLLLALLLILIFALLAFLLVGLLLVLLMLQQDGTLLGLGGGPRDSSTTPTPAAAGARQAARPRAPHLGTQAHSTSKHPGPAAPGAPLPKDGPKRDGVASARRRSIRGSICGQASTSGEDSRRRGEIERRDIYDEFDVIISSVGSASRRRSERRNTVSTWVCLDVNALRSPKKISFDEYVGHRQPRSVRASSALLPAGVPGKFSASSLKAAGRRAVWRSSRAVHLISSRNLHARLPRI